MTPRDFCYWLQGYMEINGLDKNPKEIPKNHAVIINNHLNLVFHHSIDNQYEEGDGSQEVHDGKKHASKKKPPYKDKPTIAGFDPNQLKIRC